MTEPVRRDEVTAALAAVHASRAAIAGRLIAPWWLWPITGSSLGAVTASYAAPRPLPSLIGMAAVVVSWVIMWARHRSGRWLLPARTTSGRRWTIAFGAVVFALFVGSIVVHDAGWHSAPVVAGGVVLILSLIFGRLMTHAALAELKGSSAR